MEAKSVSDSFVIETFFRVCGLIKLNSEGERWMQLFGQFFLFFFFFLLLISYLYKVSLKQSISWTSSFCLFVHLFLMFEKPVAYMLQNINRI